MRHLLLSLLLLTGAHALAQAPLQFSFQAVVRDASDELLADTPVGLRISILQGSINGAAVYVETHSTTTNTNGLVSLQVGGGTVQSGSLVTIDWGNGPYFIKSETDPSGGTNYTIAGTQQMMSVPYALFAANAGGGNGEFVSAGGVVRNTSNVSTDNFVFGSSGLDDISGTDDDSRFFLNKAKGAFRAGQASGNQWNDANLGNGSFAAGSNTVASGIASTALGNYATASGNYSTAMGNTATASGTYAVAMGSNTTASGSNSTAMGRGTASGATSTAMGTNTIASGDYATAMGQFSTASGLVSVSMGRQTSASGYYSTAMGYKSTAPSQSETVIGQYNTAYTLGTNGGVQWNATDRLFTIGNGTSDASRSDAMVVLKNGNTGLGTTDPKSKLQVSSGDVYIDNSTSGVIMKSPNGQCWRMTVSDAGTPVFTLIACP